MREFIEILILSTLWCTGVWVLFADGMPLGFVNEWIKNGLPGDRVTTLRSKTRKITIVTIPWIVFTKPFWNCLPCMASLHGLFWYFLTIHSVYGVWPCIPFVICLAGLNFIVSQCIEE